jgi:hypothetical protein
MKDVKGLFKKNIIFQIILIPKKGNIEKKKKINWKNMIFPLFLKHNNNY